MMQGARAASPVRIPRARLEQWTARILTSAGLGAEDARLAAEFLVRTDARGFKTHGLARLTSYLDKIASGEIAPDAVLSRTVSGNLLRINAGGMLGQVAGPNAVDEAVALARTQPIVACQLQDASHLGALGIHVLRAAEAGLVALMFQATPPIMGVPGALQPLIGNNPLAMAAPRPNGPPIVIDMACCVAARGNILLAARANELIPEGWALDSAGSPTTDAEAALLGSLLPFGGHKGMALAMMVEILAGSLAGVPFKPSLNQEGGIRSGTGHMNAMVLVLSPDLMQGRGTYEEHVTAWTDHLKNEGGTAARIPGERAHESELDAERHGVPLLTTIVEDLTAAGSAAGVPFPGPV